MKTALYCLALVVFAISCLAQNDPADLERKAEIMKRQDPRFQGERPIFSVFGRGLIDKNNNVVLDVWEGYVRINGQPLNLSGEPAITPGTTAQYWRGDKTWQTLDKIAVGLGNVENTAISDWAGSTSLITVGTVSTGTWQASPIDGEYIGDGIAAAKVDFTQAATGAVPRTLQSRGEDWVSVKDFGAVGDGVADDTDEINAAVTAAKGAKKAIFFPSGTYNTSTGLTIDWSGAVIYGEGSRANSKIVVTDVDEDGIDIVDGGAGNLYNITVRDIEFVGQLSGTGMGIDMGTGSVIKNGVLLENVFVHGFGSYGLRTAYVDYLTIVRCKFEESQAHQWIANGATNAVTAIGCAFTGGSSAPSGTSGVHAVDMDAVALINCEFGGTHYGFTSDASGIPTTNVAFIGCRWEVLSVYCVELNSGGVSFRDCTFYGDNVLAALINIVGASYPGVLFDRCVGVQIPNTGHMVTTASATANIRMRDCYMTGSGSLLNGNGTNYTGAHVGYNYAALPVINGGTGTATGSITGTGALTFTAGGSNQDINLVPSGAGKTTMTSTAALQFQIARAGGYDAWGFYQGSDGINSDALFLRPASNDSTISFQNNSGSTTTFRINPNAGHVVIPFTGGGIRFGSATGAFDTYGTGSPESAITAPIGSLFRRTDGGSSTSLYIKESGSGNTGWAAVGSLDADLLDLADGSLTGSKVASATDATQGAVELASSPETLAGVSNALVVTPAGLAASALFSQLSTVGNVGAGEDTLISAAIAADTLSANGQAIHAILCGVIEEAATPALRIKFGTNLLFEATMAAAAGDTTWSADVWIVRTGAATQRSVVIFNREGVSVVDERSPTQTLSGSVNFIVTGQGTADNDATVFLGKGMFVP